MATILVALRTTLVEGMLVVGHIISVARAAKTGTTQSTGATVIKEVEATRDKRWLVATIWWRMKSGNMDGNPIYAQGPDYIGCNGLYPIMKGQARAGQWNTHGDPQ